MGSGDFLYEASGPVGTWGWQDDGVYAVAINNGDVVDLQGDTVGAGEIGTFYVGLVAPDLADLVPVMSGSRIRFWRRCSRPTLYARATDTVTHSNPITDPPHHPTMRGLSFGGEHGVHRSL
jgi:hypothetical protein